MKNLQATIDHGAVPYIPFKSNAQADRGTDVWSKMFFFYNYKREEFLAHYHKPLKCRERLSNDQVEVWREAAE